jgi:hypothetical protein
MRLSTALRVASIIIAAKTVLIALVYWRRAEILGHPLHIGTGNWIGLITIVAIVLAIAAAIYIAAPRFSRRVKREP